VITKRFAKQVLYALWFQSKIIFWDYILCFQVFYDYVLICTTSHLNWP